MLSAKFNGSSSIELLYKIEHLCFDFRHIAKLQNVTSHIKKISLTDKVDCEKADDLMKRNTEAHPNKTSILSIDHSILNRTIGGQPISFNNELRQMISRKIWIGRISNYCWTYSMMFIK